MRRRASSPCALTTQGENGGGVRHITYSDKTLFVDDATADVLIRYAAALAATGGADAVTVKAVGADGNEVEASIVLNPTTEIVAETTNTLMRPPQNDEVVRYMGAAIDRLTNPPTVHPASPPEPQEQGMDDV